MSLGNYNLLGGVHLLQALGFNAGGFYNQLQGQQTQTGSGGLQQMLDSFGAFAAGMAVGQLASMLQNGVVPGSGVVSRPSLQRGATGDAAGSYAPSQNFDLGATGGNPFSLESLFQRGKAAQFEQFLQSNPVARGMVEMMLGGKVLPGNADGIIQVQPFSGGQNPSGSPAANGAMNFLDQVARSAMGFAMPAGGGGMLNQMVLGGLANVLGLFGQGGATGQGGSAGGGGLRSQGGGSPFVDWNDSRRLPPGMGGAGTAGNAGNAGNAGGGGGFPGIGGGFPAGGGGGFPVGGGGYGAGAPNPNQAAFGTGGGDGGASAALNDPGLTVEDKIVLMLMLIMKKMDKDIEKQANYINSLQQQQNGGGGGGGGGKGGGGGGKGGGGSSPSIDVETMKLKRLIDKRSQMFDMLRQIIDKYNETAKNMIQAIGR